MKTFEDSGTDPGRLRTARNLRRVGLVLLLALLALGVSGVLDPEDGEVSASGPGVRLTASYPARARAGLDSPLELTVERPGGFGRQVDVAVSREWLDLFDQTGIEPEPSSATSDGDRVIWSFDPPPGERLGIQVELVLRPAVRTGHSARVAVLEGDSEAAAVEFDTTVVP